MVFLETADVNEFLQIVLVRNVASISESALVRRSQREGSGTHLPHQATTSKGVCSCLHSNSLPPSLNTTDGRSD